MQKVKDLAVKVGEYKTKDGKTKGQYESVGSIMQTDTGSFILLNRTFNPAGVANPENRSSVIVSIFDPRSNEERGKPAVEGADDSDLPF
jgi:hypothetical protein